MGINLVIGHTFSRPSFSANRLHMTQHAGSNSIPLEDLIPTHVWFLHLFHQQLVNFHLIIVQPRATTIMPASLACDDSLEQELATYPMQEFRELDGLTDLDSAEEWDGIENGEDEWTDEVVTPAAVRPWSNITC